MDRFKLENQITGLHSIVDSINDISYGVLETDMDKDDISNALDGLAVMVDIKIQKLFDTFTATFGLDQYNEEDCDCETDLNY